MKARWASVVFSGAAAVMLAGCIQQGQLAPSSDAGWTARDRQQLTNPPYAQASIPQEYQRQIVSYNRREAPGTVVVDTRNRYLYYVLPKGQALRYGVTVGEEGQSWSGVAKVGRKTEWPSWTPAPGERQRLGTLPNCVAPGVGVQLGH